MSQPKLNELVQQARRDRPAPGVLSAVARSLRVPFLAMPIVAVMTPSSAAAAAASALAKGGLSRAAWLAWGGSAAAVSGVAAAVLLTQPPAPVPATLPPPPVPRLPSVPPAPARAAEVTPEAPAEPPVERRASAGSPAVWDEPQLIERARKALAAEPRRALSLAQEHQRRFPTGALSLEREVIIIEALSRSGQTSEARRRALSFESRYPKSIHLPRIRALRERLGR
jgi:hypothetical protein